RKSAARAVGDHRNDRDARRGAVDGPALFRRARPFGAAVGTGVMKDRACRHEGAHPWKISPTRLAEQITKPKRGRTGFFFAEERTRRTNLAGLRVARGTRRGSSNPVAISMPALPH